MQILTVSDLKHHRKMAPPQKKNPKLYLKKKKKSKNYLKKTFELLKVWEHLSETMLCRHKSHGKTQGQLQKSFSIQNVSHGGVRHQKTHFWPINREKKSSHMIKTANRFKYQCFLTLSMTQLRHHLTFCYLKPGRESESVALTSTSLSHSSQQIRLR